MEHTIMDGLEPQAVLQYFYQISQIPRAPGNKKPISDFVAGCLRAMKLEVRQDASYNVIARKPASAGYTSAPVVMLQGHLDMVCEKEPAVQHDFDRDPIRIVVEGDVVKADGTTLGADDGLGVAVILAIMADNSLAHPALEAVFTTDEETDMNGALGLDFSQLQSKIILNVDAAPILVSGAGEMEIRMSVAKSEAPVRPGSVSCMLEISGLLGGHSGAQAMTERGNAVTLLNRALCMIEKTVPLQIVSLQGGQGCSTAFARHADAVIAFDKDRLTAVRAAVAQCQEIYATELRTCDPDVTVTLRLLESGAARAFSAKTAETVLTLLACLPDGVFTRNKDYDGLMESCANVGVLETRAQDILVASTIRSTMRARKDYLYEKTARLARAGCGLPCQPRSAAMGLQR